MSWTQGQQNRTSQSPFIDPVTDDRPQKPSTSGYSKPNVQRNDYSQRQPQNNVQQRQPQVKDVAATFTQEGLQTFSLIFSSAVEAAIAKTLPDLVERAVERKMQLFAKQVSDDVHRLAEDALQSLAKHAFTVVEQQVETFLAGLSLPAILTPQAPDEAVQPVVTSEPSAEPIASSVPEVPARLEEDPFTIEEHQSPMPDVSTDTDSHLGSESRLGDDEMEPQLTVSRSAALNNDTADEARLHSTGRSEQEVQTLVQTMKKLNRPVKTDELKTLIPDIKWGSNPSIKMSHLMQKSNGQIERKSKGIYQYKKA